MNDLDDLNNIDVNVMLRLENQLCFSLYAVSREVIKLYKPILDEFDLTYTQYIAMLALWDQENALLSFKVLGNMLHLDSGTLTPLIKKLEGADLVHKYRDPNDDRSVIVALTAKGIALKERAAEIPQRVYCQLSGDPNDLWQLKQGLDALLAKL